MDTRLKVVTRLPLTELWDGHGFATTSRVRRLAAEDIVSLLGAGRVRFVVADVGAVPRWIPIHECCDFWKTEVRLHLAAPDSRASLDAFPGGYCYFASEWCGGDGTRIVVCEKHH